MPLSVVQAVSAQATGAATSVTSPSFNSTTGNLLVACGTSQGTPAATPFTDNNSLTWAQAVANVADSGSPADQDIQYYSKNITGRSGHTVTYSLTGAGPPSVAVVEISGADTAAPLDKTASRGSTTTESNPHTTGTTATTAQANEICVASGTHSDIQNNTFASNNGYTIQTSQTNTANQPVVLSTKIVSATGTQGESYNLSPNSSLNFAGDVATYIAAAAVAAIAPAVTVIRHLFSPPRIRPRLFTPTYNSGGIVPRFTQGTRRNNFARPASRRLPAPTYNSGGIVPQISRGVKRGIAKPIPPRSLQPAFNSGGIQPRLTVVPHPLRWKPVPPQSIRPRYNSGGITPSVSVTRHPWRFPALRSRLVIPPPIVAVAAGVAPLVSIVRHPLRWKPAPPQSIQPRYNSGGITPTVNRGKFWPRVRPTPPQSLRPVYNSGGRIPTTTSVRHPFQLKPVPPRGVRPTVGAPPSAPQVTVVRHPLRWRPIGPQSIRPGYNSGGIAPAVNRGRSWPRVKSTSPQNLRPVYNSGGLLPRVSAGVKRLAVKLKLPRWIPGLLPPVITGPGSVQVQLWDAFPVAVEFTEPFSAMAATLEAFSVAVELSDIFGGSMAWYVGKAVRIANWGGPNTTNASGGFRNASGTLYDPATPSLKYILPGGTVQTVSGGSLTKDGVGLYSYIVTPTQDGDALATYLSNDGAYADPIAFKIEKAPL